MLETYEQGIMLLRDRIIAERYVTRRERFCRFPLGFIDWSSFCEVNPGARGLPWQVKSELNCDTLTPGQCDIAVGLAQHYNERAKALRKRAEKEGFPRLVRSD